MSAGICNDSMSNITVIPPREPRVLIYWLLEQLQSQQRVALLTLVAIDGSAPYPIGSQMAINETGEYIGQITGGCAEAAIAQHAVEAIKAKKNHTHRYGLNSPFFDIRLPCGSGIDVFFDVATSMKSYQVLAQGLRQRSMVTSKLTPSFGPFTKHYLPTERLVVFGQGPILLALINLAVSTHFEVIVIVKGEADRRQLQRHGFASQTLQIVGDSYTETFDEFTAVVSLFHEHENETPILSHAIRSQVFYIGALGSRTTHQQRVNDLIDSGCVAADIERIRGPIGLDIVAETPAQIALSILAEMVLTMPKQRVN